MDILFFNSYHSPSSLKHFCSAVDEEVKEQQKTLLAEINFDDEILKKHDLKAGLEENVFEENLKKAFADVTKQDVKSRRDKTLEEIGISKNTVKTLTHLSPGLIYNFTESQFNDWIIRAIETEKTMHALKGNLEPSKEKVPSNNVNEDSAENSENGNVGQPGLHPSQALARQYYNSSYFILGGGTFFATLLFILKR